MCLNTVSLNLKYDKKRKRFIGQGYKSIHESELDRYNKSNWMTATGSYFNKIVDNSIEVEASDRNVYFPGFHIFLNEKDARKYGHRSNKIYLVEYTNAIAFGTNAAGFAFGSDGIIHYGDCVVATRMRLKKELT